MPLGSSTRRTLGWQFFGLSLLLAALIGLGSALQRRATAAMAELGQDAATARQQIGAVSQVLERLLDAETGQRGFLLTRKPAYLQPFDAATVSIGSALATLRKASTKTAWLRLEVEPLAILADAKMLELQQAIDRTAAGDILGALGVVSTDRGMQLMDEVRLRVGIILKRLDHEVEARAGLLQERQARLALGTEVATLVGILALGLTLAVALFIRARLIMTQQAERLVGERLAAAIDRIRDGVAVFDANDLLILRNDRLAPVLNLWPGQVQLGQSRAAIAAAAAIPALSAMPDVTVEPVIAMLGGRTLELWQGSMTDGGRVLAVADISRRVAAEEIARQAQKMEVLGQMTGGVAHDFNNLLQVVSGNLEMAGSRLARSPAPDPWIQTRLDAARSGVVRGPRLTRHLLVFARRQPLAPESVDPSRLLIGLEDMLGRTVGGAIRLELVTGSGLWAVRADPNQLENALLNLALNSRDSIIASGTNRGCLTIEARNTTLDATYIESRHEVLAGTYVVFSVTDNGTGMTAEQLERATEPFYTTKLDGHGSGLGLSMVFGFAKQSGGHFQLFSELGQETTAKLYLPRTDIPANLVPVPVPFMGHGGRGERILLVEDDASVRTTAAEVLRSLGYSVVDAESADAALQLIEQGLRPDLLFTDVVMPGNVTARTLAERAAAMVPGLPVVFTSGFTQDAIAHNGTLDLGVTLISKPWQLEELASELRRALDQRLPPEGLPAPSSHRARTVLLVEDEPLVRMTTAETLSDLGYRVLQAATAREALAHAAEADLVLLDLGLPDLPGLDLAKSLRAIRPAVKIVIASGQGQPTPGFDWLPKPYDTAALTKTLARAWSDGP